MTVAYPEPKQASRWPDVRVVEPAELRRALRRQGRAPGWGLRLPHDRCLVVPAMTGNVILVAQPLHQDQSEIERRIVHARVHHLLDNPQQASAWTPARVRERIHALGQTAFDEVRRVLHDDRHLPPGASFKETWVEFAALWCELRRGPRAAIEQVFPLLDPACVDKLIARDLDLEALVEGLSLSLRAPAAEEPAGHHVPSSIHLRTARHDEHASDSPPALSPAPDIDVAPQQGNIVRALLGGDQVDDQHLEALTRRLSCLLALPITGGSSEPGASMFVDELRGALRLLVNTARRAPVAGFLRRMTPEARVLFDLQRACIDRERTVKSFDVFGFLSSFGQRPLVRTLNFAPLVRSARHIRSALEKLPRTRLPRASRELVTRVLRHMTSRAEDVVRIQLRPIIGQALADERLTQESATARVASRKITEELLDVALAKGQVGLSDLRDALSRNRQKLPDLDGVRTWLRGDELLRLDARFARDLGGVYRPGEVYLRALQRGSSLAFGTNLGRLVTMYLVLPLLCAFVLLEGTQHLLHALGGLVASFGGHLHPPHLLTRTSFTVLSIWLFGIFHVKLVREASILAARTLGRLLRLVLIGLPRSLLSLYLVRRLTSLHIVRRTARLVLVPAMVFGAARLLAMHGGLGSSLPPLPHAPDLIGLAAALAMLALVGTRRGLLVLERSLEWLADVLIAWQQRLLPGLLAWIMQTFRQLTDRVEQALYAVDELFRFRSGEMAALRAVKILGTVVWGTVTVLVRFYVTVLIEPQVNPIKHFPVVTVSHKLMLPFYPVLFPKFVAPLVFLGPVLAGAIAGATLFLLPGVFGFLVWELKENRRLYQVAQPSVLVPVLVGSHGETMAGLLRPGFHSGTLPKLQRRLRRAAARNVRRAFVRDRVARHLEALHHVQKDVQRFVERELLALLAETPRWTSGALRVSWVDLGGNQIRVAIRRRSAPSMSPPSAKAAEPVVICWEEQSGLVLGSVARRGFLDSLPASESEAFDDAVRGLHKLAAVDILREDLATVLIRANLASPRLSIPPDDQTLPNLDSSPAYDIADEGLVVWPDGSFGLEVVYPLTHNAHSHYVGTVRATADGEQPESPPPLPRSDLSFRHRPMRWEDWTRRW